MMTISSTVTDASVQVEPKAKSRNLSLDRARTFLTLVVLLHHAVIPYTYFGHTDPKYFFGFDMIVLASLAALWLWLTRRIKPTWRPARATS